ncbi:MAG: hypothetical protein M1837_002544 [Sclerophora amabilis]|nr:MAG: hypothetical protein M1837_002544 [Sclerophora amabilis]
MDPPRRVPTLPSEVEILVHVSAPSGANDDARYRAQAAGYLGFESELSTYGGCAFLGGRLELQNNARASGNQLEEDGRWGLREWTEVPGSGFVKDTVNDEASSSLDFSLYSGSKGSFDSARVDVPRTTSTSRKRAALLQPEASSPPYKRLRSSSPCVHSVHCIKSSQDCSQGGIHDAESDVDNGGQDVGVGEGGGSLSPSPSNFDSWATPPSVIADSQPSIPGLHTPHRPPGPRSNLTFIRPRSPLYLPARRSRSRSPPTNIATTLPPVPGSSEIVFPPPPATSTDTNVSSHITPALATLARQLPLTTHFRPHVRLQTQPLDPLERGHWAFSTSSSASFPPEAITSFWSFLESFIGKGKAGWGVWAWRGCSEQNEEINRRNDVNAGENAGRVESAEAQTKGNDARDLSKREMNDGKVYCWGEVVGHIWLLLVVASQRRIKNKSAGARWLDGAGRVVVEMR